MIYRNQGQIRVIKNTSDVITSATTHLHKLGGHVFDLLTVSKPVSPDAALNLAKIISKLSPLIGNLIEFNTVEFLNDQDEFSGLGSWKRQDPGFPDTIFDGSISPTPGFEIKAWFPLATEITARFKDSQNHFADDHTYVCMLAWLPESLIFGRPKIIDVCVVSGKSVAKARDDHYHNPPDYLVLEPEDTTFRTSNLQQTNTNGYKWQGTPEQFEEAMRIVSSWGAEGLEYSPSIQYQKLVRELMARFPYRLDTNYAKMDRIAHKEIEQFKSRVMRTSLNGMKISEWRRLIRSKNDALICTSLSDHLGIKDIDSEQILR
jgi:hypothetical protein